MRIGIHNEPSGAGIGGAEYLVAMIAETLSGRNDVEIIHHRPSVDLGEWSAFSGTLLRGVRLRYLEPESARPQSSNPSPIDGGCFRSRGDWQAELSRPYDLFITVTHSVPPYCLRPAGVLIVLFPMSRRSDEWPWSEPIPSGAIHLRMRTRERYYDWEWRSASTVTKARCAISEFSRKWTQAYLGSRLPRAVSSGRYSLYTTSKKEPNRERR